MSIHNDNLEVIKKYYKELQFLEQKLNCNLSISKKKSLLQEVESTWKSLNREVNLKNYDLNINPQDCGEMTYDLKNIIDIIIEIDK